MDRMQTGHNNRSSAGAFTLVEVMVVLVIISALVVLIIPASERVIHRARAASCMGNLRNLGMALNSYLSEHNNTMPNMVIARETMGDDPPALDTVLAPYAGNAAVFRCPADAKKIWEKTGTSYLWNNLLNEQNAASLNFMGLITSGNRIPVVSDKENFHKYRDFEVNILYADGHVGKELQFTVGGK